MKLIYFTLSFLISSAAIASDINIYPMSGKDNLDKIQMAVTGNAAESIFQTIKKGGKEDRREGETPNAHIYIRKTNNLYCEASVNDKSGKILTVKNSLGEDEPAIACIFVIGTNGVEIIKTKQNLN